MPADYKFWLFLHEKWSKFGSEILQHMRAKLELYYYTEVT